MLETIRSLAGKLHLTDLSAPSVTLPQVGEIFYRRPEFGPVEYAEVIGRYEEADRIQHIRFRLVLGYRDKQVEAGERTLAIASFLQRFSRRMPPKEGVA